MAQVDVYVDPDATGSGDGTSYTDAYTSLNAAEAAEETDLVTDGDFIVFHCRASLGNPDFTSTTFSGWTTGASNYIEVTTDESEATGRHDGTGTLDTSTYRMNVTGGRCIFCLEEYFRISGLQLFSSSTECFRYGGVTGVGDVRVEKTLFTGRSANFTGGLLSFNGSASGTTCKIKNNVFADHDGSENTVIFFSDANLDVYVFANTFKNCSRGIRHLTVPNSSSYENNVISAGDAFIGSGFTAGRNWISQNTNEVDSNGDYNCTFTWDSTNTYQLDKDTTQDGTNNNDAIQGGADLSSDTDLPVSDDFAGTSRSSTPDAGAHEVTLETGITLTIQEITQSQTIDNIGLIQQNILSINDIAQLQELFNLDLLQSNILGIDSIIQSQVLDVLNLVQQHLLIINDLVQIQTSEEVVLTQANVLIVNDISQSQTLENLELFSGLSLNINNISQAQNLQNLDLTQANVLLINDITQIQTLDNISLPIGVILEIANIVQAQNIDVINLTQNNVLVIDGIEQIQSIETLTLDTATLLQIANIIQSQSIESLNLTQQNTLEIDNLLQSQEINNVILVFANGKVTITFVMKTPNISYELKTPNISYELK